jgi:4a-hydroxytetrahydrobiopterin dehydratase
MQELKNQHCRPMSKGMPSLGASEVSAFLVRLHGEWHSSDQADTISRQFKFKNFYHTMAFVNAVAWIANQEDHHPDLAVSYSNCEVSFSTHAVGGLTENDFICAAKIDALVTN